MFNAFKYIKKLEAVGFRRDQAEVQVQLVLDSIEEEVATKGDIADVRADFSKLRGEFGDLRGEFGDLRGEFGNLRAEFAELRSELRTEFAEFKVDIMVKLGATIVGSITIATAVIGLLVKH